MLDLAFSLRQLVSSQVEDRIAPALVEVRALRWLGCFASQIFSLSPNTSLRVLMIRVAGMPTWASPLHLHLLCKCEHNVVVDLMFPPYESWRPVQKFKGHIFEGMGLGSCLSLWYEVKSGCIVCTIGKGMCKSYPERFPSMYCKRQGGFSEASEILA